VVDTAVVERLDLKELMYERGSTGLHRAGGWVREDRLSQLVGPQAVQTYR
jgi:hypothetical protein